jgi:hypothetical protein
MLATLLAVLVTQTPPPLIEVEFVQPPEPGPVIAEPTPVQVLEETESPAGRLATTFVGALVGLAPAFATLTLGPALCGQNETCAYGLVFSGIIAAPFTTALGAYFAHAVAGGRGTFGKAIAGATIGLLTGVAAAYLVGMAFQTGSMATDWAILASGGAVAFLITTATLEDSHRTLSGDLRLGFGPAEGGGRVSVSGRF